MEVQPGMLFRGKGTLGLIQGIHGFEAYISLSLSEAILPTFELNSREYADSQSGSDTFQNEFPPGNREQD
jgi:hypothetical protein